MKQSARSRSLRQQPLHWFGLMGLASLLWVLQAAPAAADSKTRLYSFEEGSIGVRASSVIDHIDDLLVDSAFNCCYQIDSHVPGTNDGVPGGQPLKSWITANVDATPSMDEVFAGAGPDFVATSAGGAFDITSAAPMLTTSRGVRFDGAEALQTSVGFRDTYVDRAAYESNAQAAPGDNVFGTFFALSQAWVYPESVGSGLEQVVWSVGDENGGVRIRSDGYWELTALGPPGDIVSATPVAFDQWSHVAVARTGGGATLYVNGALAAVAPAPGGQGFFNRFGDYVTLGADEDLVEAFVGVVDDFSIAGNSDGSFSVLEDIDFFSNTGFPTPTGVAGDVDQDGDADADDYLIWSANAGMNNGFGRGDFTTLVQGDLDQNGRVDFFDFQEIARAAAAAGAPITVATPSPSAAGLAVLGLAPLLCRRSHRNG